MSWEYQGSGGTNANNGRGNKSRDASSSDQGWYQTQSGRSNTFHDEYPFGSSGQQPSASATGYGEHPFRGTVQQAAASGRGRDDSVGLGRPGNTIPNTPRRVPLTAKGHEEELRRKQEASRRHNALELAMRRNRSKEELQSFNLDNYVHTAPPVNFSKPLPRRDPAPERKDSGIAIRPSRSMVRMASESQLGSTGAKASWNSSETTSYSGLSSHEGPGQFKSYGNAPTPQINEPRRTHELHLDQWESKNVYFSKKIAYPFDIINNSPKRPGLYAKQMDGSVKFQCTRKQMELSLQGTETRPRPLSTLLEGEELVVSRPSISYGAAPWNEQGNVFPVSRPQLQRGAEARPSLRTAKSDDAIKKASSGQQPLHKRLFSTGKGKPKDEEEKSGWW